MRAAYATLRPRIEYENAPPPPPRPAGGGGRPLPRVLQWQSWFFSVFKRVLIRGYALV